MKKCMLRGIALAAMAGFILTAKAQDTVDQSQYPVILEQPVDQCLPIGSTVTFSVTATNTDTYQWYKNNAALDGQTNSSLVLSNVSTNDVAYYSVSVIKDSEGVPSRMACLNVYISSAASKSVRSLASGTSLKTSMTTMSTDLGSGGPIVVFGPPVVSSGNSSGCPGSYSGYVNYVKTVSQGWGWAPTAGATTLMATDANRDDTKVQYMGKSGDPGCGQTSVTIPYPAFSAKYRFTIFFTSNVPTNAYPITLTGFDQ
jgi:hypothetical protein